MLSKKKISLLLSEIPQKTGVYQYYDVYNKLLYVGKAKNLKTRVSSYFSKKQPHLKTALLVNNIHNIKYVVLSSELDALLLENNLIKKHQPKYNIKLKDDKTYPWICISNEKFPRIFQTRKIIKNGSEYYGPYMSTHVVKILLNCFSDLFYDNGWTPFSYIQRDFNPRSRKQYITIVEEIKTLLRGEMKNIIHRLKKKMKTHSLSLEFEKAQKTKKNIIALQKHQSKATIVNPKINNVDVFSLQNENQYSYVNYLKVISGAVVQTHTLEIKKTLNESTQDVLQLAITELRSRFFSLSKNIYCSHKINNVWKNICFTVPRIGDKKKLVDVSLKNGKYFLLQNKKRRLLKSQKSNFNQVLLQLKADLNLPKTPVHIECFDNSNLQGMFPVGACVVFKNGKPKKKEYRYFNIKTVKKSNDFKSMEEIVFRRYRRLLMEKKSLPQLIIIDGGRGQVSSAFKSLKKLNLLNNIVVVGIAKKLEQLFFANERIPLYLDKRSTSLKLIQHLRDEAHRFGIALHRKKRKKALLTTSLDSIPGIGEKTIAKLIAHFGSVKKIFSAKKEEVEMLIGKSKAKKIF